MQQLGYPLVEFQRLGIAFDTALGAGAGPGVLTDFSFADPMPEHPTKCLWLHIKPVCQINKGGLPALAEITF